MAPRNHRSRFGWRLFVEANAHLAGLLALATVLFHLETAMAPYVPPMAEEVP